MSKADEHGTQPKMTRKQYDKELRKLQTELCRLQEWVIRCGNGSSARWMSNPGPAGMITRTLGI